MLGKTVQAWWHVVSLWSFLLVLLLGCQGNTKTRDREPSKLLVQYSIGTLETPTFRVLGSLKDEQALVIQCSPKIIRFVRIPNPSVTTANPRILRSDAAPPTRSYRFIRDLPGRKFLASDGFTVDVLEDMKVVRSLHLMTELGRGMPGGVEEVTDIIPVSEDEWIVVGTIHGISVLRVTPEGVKIVVRSPLGALSRYPARRAFRVGATILLSYWSSRSESTVEVAINGSMKELGWPAKVIGTGSMYSAPTAILANGDVMRREADGTWTRSFALADKLPLSRHAVVLSNRIVVVSCGQTTEAMHGERIQVLPIVGMDDRLLPYGEGCLLVSDSGQVDYIEAN